MTIKLLLSSAAVILTSPIAWGFMFDHPTGLEMQADRRANAIMGIPQLQDEAEKDVDEFISKPHNHMVIQQLTRSHEKMGTQELASHLTVAELLKQKMENPITEANFDEKVLLMKGVSGKYMVNKVLFEQGDVNTFFTNKEIKEIEKRLQEKSIEEYINSLRYNSIFFGYSY